MGISFMFIFTVSASFIVEYLKYDFQSICRGEIRYTLHIIYTYPHCQHATFFETLKLSLLHL